ncbi:pyruvate dehydrogenase phosphatase regulatory subunit, mitochondrial-like [Biomphalaria glabrata]|uniref:Pyruvate dehydrogenase phosphatase regulatory subunit, mitochondrial-like n=2 Tax=Biomphalaria glabrata TaxID=6526 RepID=A0A9W3AVL5_BIOGL|nr:pyruvate dehydrogenase phosphatase regulatory subunit, mitochondrial-like [Biomphalaria glabrata]
MLKLSFPPSLFSLSSFKLSNLPRLSNRLHTSSVACNSQDEHPTVPSHCKVVICGGGIVGSSVAYHLAERGWTDVVIVEQGSLTCGTTWHAAGLIGRVRTSPTEMKILDYSRKLYESIQKTGHDVGWKQTGSIALARTKDRLVEFKRKHAVAKTIGLETHIITPAEAKERCPLLFTDDIVGAMWIPHDGVVDSKSLSLTLAKLAHVKGVMIVEGVGVTKVTTKKGSVREVETTAGTIHCDYFVNCAGQWARALGKKTFPKTVKAPLHSCEHYYMVTKPQVGIDSMMPVIRDYDGQVYLREYNRGILAGGFDLAAKPCFHKGIPDRFEFQQLQADWDHFHSLLDNITHRMPILNEAEVDRLFNGPESFTPDSKCIMGKSPKLKNYFLAAGMNSSGIVAAGGVGKNIADWIVDGDTKLNLWPFDVRRFVRLHNNKKFLKDRIPEAVANHYQLKYPREEYKTGRKLRCSPLHTRLEVAGAVFGETMAYERAMYFAQPSDSCIGMESGNQWSWAKPCWFENVQEEYWACKERVCIMDMSSFAKFDVKSQGDEATKYLNYLCSNKIDNDLGTIVHTGMHNIHGGFENDCTVARLEPNHYFIICPATQQTRCIAWLNYHLPPDGSVQVTDVTSMFSGINIIGPHAQQLLADVSEFPTTKTAFRPMTSNVIDVGHASSIRAMRLTHTGEDGFILYIPAEYALHVYDTLMTAGKDYGIRNAGYYALRHLRIENFFAFWGLDLDDKTSPLECGRGFRTKLDEHDDFIGKSALLRERQNGVKRRFTQFLLDDYDVHRDYWPWGGEPIYRDGQYVGLTTTCGYGFTLEKMVCLGFVGDIDNNGEYVTQRNINEWVMNKNAKYEIDIAGVRFPARPGIYTPKITVQTLDPIFVPAPDRPSKES